MYWFVAFLFREIRCLHSLKRKVSANVSCVPYVGNCLKRNSYIDVDASRSSPVRDAILNNVHGPYKTSFEGRVNWSGIIQLQRLILVCCSVLIHPPWERIISMWTISLISLLILAKCEPLKSKAMNNLAVLCQGAMVFVGGLYIYLASLEDQQVSPVSNIERIKAVYTMINVFSVIIPGICIALTVLCGLISLLKSICTKCPCTTNNSE